MLKCHELIGFISPALAQEIVESTFSADKPLYRAVLAAVAEANRVRPVFLEKRPRVQRHAEMIAALARPRMEEAAANLLRGWLLKSENRLICEFLDALGIAHENGVVGDFPETVEDVKLNEAVDAVLRSHPAEKVILYLNTVHATSGVRWQNLDQLLTGDARLQLG
jgi:hypothetical protein